MIIHMAYYLLNFGGCQGIPMQEREVEEEYGEG